MRGQGGGAKGVVGRAVASLYRESVRTSLSLPGRGGDAQSAWCAALRYQHDVDGGCYGRLGAAVAGANHVVRVNLIPVSWFVDWND